MRTKFLQPLVSRFRNASVFRIVAQLVGNDHLSEIGVHMGGELPATCLREVGASGAAGESSLSFAALWSYRAVTIHPSQADSLFPLSQAVLSLRSFFLSRLAAVRESFSFCTFLFVFG